MRRATAGEGGEGQLDQGEGHHQAEGDGHHQDQGEGHLEAEGDGQGGDQGSHVTTDAIVCLGLIINDP